MRVTQRIIFYSGLVLAAINFIYTLSFSSGWALGEVFKDFFKQAQEANHAIYFWALLTLVAAGLNILFHSHKNRNLYLVNYILIVSFSVLLLISSVITLVKVPPLKSLYLELNPTMLSIITSVNYSKINTHIFDYGIYLSILMVIQAIVIILFTVQKRNLQVNRAKIKNL